MTQELKTWPISGATSRSRIDTSQSAEISCLPSVGPHVSGGAGRVNSSRHLTVGFVILTPMIKPNAWFERPLSDHSFNDAFLPGASRGLCTGVAHLVGAPADRIFPGARWRYIPLLFP